MRESVVAIVTAWAIFNVAPKIVVGQMKLTVALTHLMLEVIFFYLLNHTQAILVIVIVLAFQLGWNVNLLQIVNVNL